MHVCERINVVYVYTMHIYIIACSSYNRQNTCLINTVSTQLDKPI